jgi:recombination protein RecT
MSKELAPYQKAIQTSKDRFVSVAGDLVNYDKESIFAMQALMKNDWSMKTANENSQSVQLAMINVASTGLTLNPSHAYAYLVPRDGAIVLDISYKGLIKIATDSGAILWARADVVYEQDTFAYHGPALIPEHQADVFKADRGKLIGAYCIAKTRDGDVLTEVMPIAEIEKIRGKSDLFKKKQSGPWVEWFVQMVKKAVIKRASKTWPYTGHSGKLFEAIELANAAEGGYTFDEEDSTRPPAAIADQRQERHDAAVEQYQPSIDAIKVAIQAENYHDVRVYWDEIPQAAQMDLWLAPTKGGIFTTHERDIIKTKLPRDVSEAAA